MGQPVSRLELNEYRAGLGPRGHWSPECLHLFPMFP